MLGGLVLSLMVTGSARTLPRQKPQIASHPSGDSAALIAHGEYLANQVAMCVQCHSPRDDHGNILEAQKFHGAAMPVSGPHWNPEWALRAPNIAGLPGFTDDQVVALLTEGQMPGRQPPMRPMPPFRMARPDAEAVVAYLRSR
jgi:hypothetical protein